MKKLLLFIALIGIGIYSYKNIYQKSFSYSNPVYLDARIGLTIPQVSRNIEMAIFVETSSQQHCAEKQQNYLSHLFKNCERCAIKSAECKAELSSHNKALFSDTHVDTTYLSFTKANNSELNARLLFWGLNSEEAKSTCRKLKTIFKNTYQGTAKCIL